MLSNAALGAHFGACVCRRAAGITEVLSPGDADRDLGIRRRFFCFREDVQFSDIPNRNPVFQAVLPNEVVGYELIVGNHSSQIEQ